MMSNYTTRVIEGGRLVIGFLALFCCLVIGWLYIGFRYFRFKKRAKSREEYEELCAEYLRKRDFQRVRISVRGADGGVDIRAKKGDWDYCCQCKFYSKPVGEPMIRDLFGAAKAENARAIFFAKSGYTKSAKERAKGRVDLIVLG